MLMNIYINKIIQNSHNYLYSCSKSHKNYIKTEDNLHLINKKIENTVFK